ncbi:hypothetical protein CN680_19190 [Bacillus pseudomycoides]|uniref:hypothetical protein n=1 Tax=Bacillus pseudomycoides TaxID=64104 RepID=UPI000BEB53DF|nr:hypothetical protein [Bacillus pseudomycoides]PED69929.1 hypothetical protein CON97_22430 [Bacillus pseudomycoides]PEI43413.1 hypothetical protein CN620_07395 [Bacillus pseudomycoides]PEJ74133.1 hypothetical protein CN680_19190 [Bacillus pseudomycoides]PEM14223.1 hypothetical protein CN628_18280 [Bacillus pseudomycoides]PEO97880.1 hypothetical protein CN550_15650 [Bacillus pseudomycoides]
MKNFLEVVGAVFLAFVNGKKVAVELNEAPEQTLPEKVKETPKQAQTFKPILHT